MAYLNDWYHDAAGAIDKRESDTGLPQPQPTSVFMGHQTSRAARSDMMCGSVGICAAPPHLGTSSVCAIVARKWMFRGGRQCTKFRARPNAGQKRLKQIRKLGAWHPRSGLGRSARVKTARTHSTEPIRTRAEFAVRAQCDCLAGGESFPGHRDTRVSRSQDSALMVANSKLGSRWLVIWAWIWRLKGTSGMVAT